MSAAPRTLAFSFAACGLAEDLEEDVGLHSAAALVRLEQTGAAPSILRDLAALDTSAPSGSLAANRAVAARLLTSLVGAWSRGDGDAVNAAREALTDTGCDRCARAALVARSRAARCTDCAVSS